MDYNHITRVAAKFLNSITAGLLCITILLLALKTLHITDASWISVLWPLPVIVVLWVVTFIVVLCLILADSSRKGDK